MVYGRPMTMTGARQVRVWCYGVCMGVSYGYGYVMCDGLCVYGYVG